MRFARVLLGTAVVVLVVLALSPSAWALSRKQADAAALAVLRPGAAGRYAVVYGYPAALPAGTTVSAAGPGPGQRWRVVRTSGGVELTARVPRTTLRAPGWLFWEDAHAGAEFPHPSRLLLLDGVTGRVDWMKTIDWYPLVNDKTAAFYRSYRDRRYLVFAAGGRVTHGFRLPAVAAGARAASAYPDACLVTVYDTSHNNDGANFSGDSTAMLKLANDFGFGGTNRTGTAGSAAALDEQVGRLVKKGCKDVVVLVAGHGAPGEGAGATAEPTVVLQSHVAPTPDGGQETVIDQAITLPDLQALVSKYNPKEKEGAKPKVLFKFVIDSCFSGRFAEELGAQYGVAFVGTSSQANELSIMSTSEDAPSDHVDGSTLYVSGLVTEFRNILDGKDANVDQQAVQSAKDDLVFALTIAADQARLPKTGTDKAATRGLTHPSVVNNTSSGPPPATLESNYSFNDLIVSFNRPAGLYGQETGTTTESFSGTACGRTPLQAAWTITVTNSESPEGVVQPPVTVPADFSKTNPFAVDPIELVTNGGATVLATATTTLALNEPALSMEVNITLTGEFTPGAGNGNTVPIEEKLLPAGKTCP